MIDIHAHLRNEEINICLSNEVTDSMGEKYRTLDLGENLCIFANEEQLETLFDEIDKKIHKETYENLQDEINKLESDIEEGNELIEQYKERTAAWKIGY